MVSFYERSGTFVRLETRDVPERPGVYELVVVKPDGDEVVEQFPDSKALLRRQQELETSLTHDGWQGPFGRLT